MAPPERPVGFAWTFHQYPGFLFVLCLFVSHLLVSSLRRVRDRLIQCLLSLVFTESFVSVLSLRITNTTASFAPTPTPSTPLRP